MLFVSRQVARRAGPQIPIDIGDVEIAEFELSTYLLTDAPWGINISPGVSVEFSSSRLFPLAKG